MNLSGILHKLSDHTDLSTDEAGYAIKRMLSGEMNESEMAAFLFGMRSKGETIEELTEFVRVMRDVAIQVHVDTDGAVDLCGTGGDYSGSFNISTTAMFVVAGAGVPVLKHGNRSISSKSGSFDVLEHLGAVPALQAQDVASCFNETGIGFMFAPLFHPALKHVMPVRKNLGLRTFFNILGPLLNPAGVRRQVVGAYNIETAQQMARILANLETEFAYTLHAHDGLDEITITTLTDIFEVNHRVTSTALRFDPTDLGFTFAKEEDLDGGDAKHNADIVKLILSGKIDSEADEAKLNVVLINAAFGIHASGKVKTLSAALHSARESILSGAASDKLDQFVAVTSSLGGVK